MELFKLLLPLLSLVSAQEQEDTRSNRILRNMAQSFMEADNDFIVSKPNNMYFPLDKAMQMNRDSGRPDYNVIKKTGFGEDISSFLAEWRGFLRVEEQDVARDLSLLFNQSSQTFRTEFGEGGLSKSELESLPLSWQYLLPHTFYDELTLAGSTWAELVNSQPMNSGLLYKVALLLRDKADQVKDRFIHSLLLPAVFREDLGYILGYRWGLAAANQSEDESDDYTAGTLLHLPTDVVMAVDKTLYDRMDVPALLEDSSAWLSASPRGQVAWFTKFLAESGWSMISSATHLALHGHLLAGANLTTISSLQGRQGEGQDSAAGVLNKTDMNPLRVQELWELLPMSETQWMFFGSAHKLDVSQLLAYYDHSFAHLYNEKAFLDSQWLGSSPLPVPWTGLMVAGLKHMDADSPSTWRQKDLLDLGKFLVLLFPPELESLPASKFNSAIFSAVLSPLLTHCQRVVLYNKYLSSSPSSPLPSLLLTALPSSTLLLLGTASSLLPSTSWDQDMSALVSASRLYTPGQMHSLHTLARPSLWQPATLATILATHPPCLADVPPMTFRVNLARVVDALYLVGPEGFHALAERLQELPRVLRMAWLEAVLVLPGSTRDQDWWDSNVLLDRNVAMEVEADGDVEPFLNPLPNSTYRQQFLRYSQQRRSYLPSLALSGMSCHCIMKVETADTLEVLAMFRFQIESSRQLAHMPAMARRCWANKVRQYLGLKASLFGVKVADELELLSLLSTSDTKAVGGELLLTWGGRALVGITHPQVQHEVLMTVARGPPHYLLHNGVGLDDIEHMAKALLDNLVKQRGSVDFTVLSHLHNLLPFADDRILTADPKDARLFISTVLRPACKSLCLPSVARGRFREFLLSAYGRPEDWSPLDLVEMGDSMVVLARSDLLRVPPTSLRRAASQLVANTLFTEYLGDVRGFPDKALYHEACSSWLGSAQRQEGAEMTKAWRGLAEFFLLGSHLQVTVVEYNIKEDSGSDASRRKRQADEVVANEVKKVYIDVMNDMKTKFEADGLTSDQKVAATKVITETQAKLGTFSFNVLGLERGDRTSQEVFAVLKEYKESGNMTGEQNTAMQDLAKDTQILMIQGIVNVFNYTVEEAAGEYNVSAAEMASLLERPTFSSLVMEERSDEDLEAILSSTSPAPPANSTSSTTTEDSLLKELDSLTTFSTQETPVPMVTSPRAFTTTSVFRRYEPTTESLAPQFASLPNLNSPEVSIGCNCIKAAGPAATALSAEHISNMKEQEVLNCLDTLGKLPWPRSALGQVWMAVQAKIPSLQKSSGSLLGRDSLMLLDSLLPAVAELSPEMIDLNKQNIDGISLLGRRFVNSDTSKQLMQRYLAENNDPTSLTGTEVASLGQLLCGLTPTQWTSLVTRPVFQDTLADHLSRLDCSVAEDVRSHLSSLLLAFYGPDTDTWTASDLLSTGWLAASLPPSSLSLLSPRAMEGLSPLAMKHLTWDRLAALGHLHLAAISPHTASFIRKDQLLPYTPSSKRRAIRAAGGESPQVKDIMEDIEVDMAARDQDDEQEDATTTEKDSAGEAEPDVASELSRSGSLESSTDSGEPETTTAGVDKAGVTAATLLVAVWLAAVNYWMSSSGGV